MIMKSVNPKMKPQIVNDDIFDKDLRCSVRELMDLKFNRTSIMPLELIKTDFNIEKTVDTQKNTHVLKLHNDIADLDGRIVNLKNEIISKVNMMNLSKYDSLNRSNLFQYKDSISHDLMNNNSDLKNEYNRLLEEEKNLSSNIKIDIEFYS